MPLHPLMQQQAAAMAAATAIGFGVTSHIAGVMFGAMQGMTGTAQKAAAATEETPAAEAAEPVASAAEAADVAPTIENRDASAKAPVKSKPVKAEPVVRRPHRSRRTSPSGRRLRLALSRRRPTT